MYILQVALLIIIGVFLFGFVIFFHELGHFITAKLSGIRVNEFAIGMGPKLFSFQMGETGYALRLLPVGGFCAMEGEDEESGDERAFGNKPVWKRMLVVVAGGAFNIILGFIFIVISLSTQEMYATNTVAKFDEVSRLKAAGGMEGDTIVEVDGYALYTDQDLNFALALADPEAVSMVVKRDGKRVDLGTFSIVSRDEKGNERISLGCWVQPEERSIPVVLRRAFFDTFSNIRMVIVSLREMIRGRFGLNELAGPVGTAQVISQAAEIGLAQSFGAAVSNILRMIILITVNLGVVNLLPLPALDGGRLLFLLWEGITRRPVPRKYEGWVHAVGLALLLVLMAVVTFNDIVRIFTGGSMG